MNTEDRDYWTIKAMKKFGGRFVKALAEAASQADYRNLHTIKDAFAEYWTHYEKMGASLQKSALETK